MRYCCDAVCMLIIRVTWHLRIPKHLCLMRSSWVSFRLRNSNMVVKGAKRLRLITFSTGLELCVPLRTNSSLELVSSRKIRISKSRRCSCFMLIDLCMFSSSLFTIMVDVVRSSCETRFSKQAIQTPSTTIAVGSGHSGLVQGPYFFWNTLDLTKSVVRKWKCADSQIPQIAPIPPSSPASVPRQSK